VAGAAATISEQVPACPGRAHEKPASLHSSLQHTPEEQNCPDAHSEGLAHTPPWGTEVAVSVAVAVGVSVAVAVAVGVSVAVAVGVPVAVADEVAVSVAVAVGVSVAVEVAVPVAVAVEVAVPVAVAVAVGLEQKQPAATDSQTWPTGQGPSHTGKLPPQSNTTHSHESCIPDDWQI